MADTAKIIQLEPDVQRHIRNRLVRLPAAAHAVHEKGKALLAARLEPYFDAADDALFDLADKASSNQDQNVFFDSMREVRVQRKSVERRFFEAYDEAFARLVAADERDRDTPATEAELSPEALSLVHNDELEQLVALESTTNRANRELTTAIARLNNGIRVLVPMPVDEHTNPLGPERLCTSFMAQVKRLDIDIKAKLVLFKFFDRVVVAELPAIYKMLEAILAQHGIDVQGPSNPAARPETAPTLSPQSTASTPAASPGVPGQHAGQTSNAGGASAYGHVAAGRAPSATGLPGGASGAGGGTHSHSASGQGPASAAQSELLSLLSFVQKLPASALSGGGGSLEQVLRRVQGHQGKNIEMSMAQHETIRLVGMLFDYILGERSLAQPVKDLLLRMQVPVAKVALLDPKFFADKQHIARRLLNEIAVQAVGWQGGDNPYPANEPLAECINRIIDTVVNEFDQDVDVFANAFSELSSFIEKEKRRSAVLERRMVDAEDGKARAEQARRKVALEVDARLGGDVLPAAVLEFSRGPWSNVLFVTGLKYGFESTQWVAHLALLSELVWSVKDKTTVQERQALIIKGPKILQSLRSGLDEVSYNPFEVSELLLAIEEIQIARIRGVKAQPAAEPLESTKPPVAQPISQTTAARQPPRVRHQSTEPPAAAAAAEDQALPSDDPFMLSVASFVQGSWFDITEGDSAEPLRCRLAAYIKPTGRYIFVNRSGMKVADKSRQQLAVALRKGKLRPVDSGMLFDRALENIVTGLRKGQSKMQLDDSGKKS